MANERLEGEQHQDIKDNDGRSVPTWILGAAAVVACYVTMFICL